jgi:outer membrane protein OmpA-like peptidoglycan-associated protein
MAANGGLPVRIGLSLLTTTALLACAASPNPNLTLAEAEYRNAAADPAVTAHAQVPLYEAKQSLDKAERAYEEGEDEVIVDHLSYLAKRRVDIARATAQRETAEDKVEVLSERRDAVVLDTRTREAEQAKMRAESAEMTASALAAELAELQAKETDRGVVITLDDEVLFDVDRSELKPGAMTQLQRIADVMKNDTQRDVLIEGHTDSTGSDSYNLGLSQRRAQAVANALRSAGVDQARIRTEGLGETMPVATNETLAGRQQNRRVEIILLEQPAAASPSPRG